MGLWRASTIRAKAREKAEAELVAEGWKPDVVSAASNKVSDASVKAAIATEAAADPQGFFARLLAALTSAIEWLSDAETQARIEAIAKLIKRLIAIFLMA